MPKVIIKGPESVKASSFPPGTIFEVARGSGATYMRLQDFSYFDNDKAKVRAFAVCLDDGSLTIVDYDAVPIKGEIVMTND